MSGISAKPDRTVVILQPGYLPWLGFFDQMYHSDIFVVYDDVQYDKHGWRNRNRIKTAQGWQWLTVPVLTGGQNKPANKDVRIDNTQNWRAKHVTAIRQHYSKAPFFNDYFDLFAAIYGQPWEYLLDLDLALIHQLTNLLGLQRDIRLASDLHIPGASTARLVAICQYLGANRFFEGAAGKRYIDESLFAAHNIVLAYQAYQHPVYRQLYGEFIPYLSIIDLLFNEGANSLNILVNAPTKETQRS